MIEFNNTLKYLGASLIPISTYLYILYDDYYSKSNVQLKEIKDLIKNDDETKFYKDILDKCDVNKNLCILSYQITKGAYDKITSQGITEYINKIRENPNPFETGNKEDVFVFQAHEDPNETSKGNLFTLYDNSSLLNQKYVGDTMNDLNKLCGEGKCDLLNIMKQITIFCDKNPNGGFVEYYWFDPNNNITISKRSFVIKINDAEYKGVKRDLYIGSGHAIETTSQQLDKFKLHTTFISSILLLLLFFIVDISTNLKNELLGNSIIIGSMIILSLNMLDRYITFYPIEEYSLFLFNNSITSRMLGALCASVAIFIGLFKKKYNNSFYILYVSALVVLIFNTMYIETTDSKTVRNVVTFKQLSNFIITILLYIVFIFIVIVYK